MKRYTQAVIPMPGRWPLDAGGQAAHPGEAIRQATVLVMLLTLLAPLAHETAMAEPVVAAGAVCIGGTGSGDVDGDGYVDHDDLAWLPFCLVGPNGGLAGPVCKCFLMDGDDDVDLVDTGTVIGMFSVPIGCTVNDRLYAPGERGEFPENCGVCDPAVSTTSLTPVGAGTLCNKGSGDLCDPDEVCNGSATKCPPDSFQSAATVCNLGSGDLCDPDEFCPGVPDAKCPVDTVAPNTRMCRAGSGDACDPAEFCTGIADAKCPPDSFASSDTVCNPGSGDLCDPDEYCPGVPGGKCPTDHVASAGTVCNPGSGDVCDPDELCSGVADKPCPSDVFASAGTPCRPAAGDCDLAETCAGAPDLACPPDVKRSASFVCRAGTTTCDPAETCNGTSDDCPPDTGPSSCENGEPCAADGQCLSGSCNGGVCTDGNAGLGASCDSTADCFEGYTCTGGVCLGIFGTYCTRLDQCGNQLACDAEASGECRVAVGVACASDLECQTNATCLNGVCRLNMNEACSTSDECGSGYCSCPSQVCDIQSGVCQCVPQGVCRVPFGGVCYDWLECADQLRVDGRLAAGYEHVAPGVCDCPTERYCDAQGGGGVCLTNSNGMRYCNTGICLPPVCVGPGTCGYGKLLLGAICEYDPPGGTFQDPPQLGDSPNDELCGSGYCFKRSTGENGPCTPARVCSNTTIGGRGPGGYCQSNADCPNGTCLNPCGRFDNPPDYFCCRNLNGVCSRDSDCCGSFLDAARGCGSNGRCRLLAREDEPCVTTADCVRFGRSGALECVEDQFGSKLCTHPGDTPGLDEGDPCDPTAPNGYCRVGLTCFNCEQSGLGYICANANAPCCSNGEYDGWCPLELVRTDPDTLSFIAVPGLCCNHECVNPQGNDHCGACDNDCRDELGNACVVQDSGTCVWNGSDLACRWTENTSLCPDPDPNDNYATRCWPTGTDTYRCDNYVPIVQPQDWVNLCVSGSASGRECTSTSQCWDCSESCTCDRPSTFSLVFGISGRCDCP